MSNQRRRLPIGGRYTQEQVALASRNSGMPLEALRYDLTPAGLHYLLIHFDIPATKAAGWKLWIAGLVSRPPAAPHAWQRWIARWRASPGAHELRCRATDRSGATQPLEPVWDLTGFGNNAAQRVEVVVR